MKKFLIIVSLFVISINMYSQKDTEFWFATPYCYRGTDSNDSTKLSFVSYDQPTTITISQPANPAFTPQVITLAPNTFKRFNMTPYRTQNTPSNTALNYGWHIVSNNPICAYYAIWDDGETYTLKGKNALGTSFIVPMQNTLANSGGGGSGAENIWTSSIEMVATADNTTVTIKLLQACIGHSAGTFTQKLNKGQSYVLKATGTSAASHLHNTVITSDNPIAVNSTDDQVVSNSSKDLIGDQIVPVALAGSRYIAVPNPYFIADAGHTNQERVFIYPVNNTIIHINNGAALPLTKGLSYSYPLPAATLITSEGDLPFLVFQMSANLGTNGAELGGGVVPNISCSGTNDVTYQAMYSSQSYTIIVRTKDIGRYITPTREVSYFKVNGITSTTLLPHAFVALPADPTWSYCTTSLGTGVTRIQNDSGVFHVSVLDANSITTSFKYFSNFNPVPLSVASNKTFYVTGDNIQLTLNNASELTNLKWVGPNGFTDTIANPVIKNATLANAGMYTVTAERIGAGCTVIPDTFMVSVLQKPIKTGVALCLKNSVTLTAAGYSPYLWTPGGSTLQAITVTPVDTTTLIYKVSNYKAGVNLALNGDFQAGDTLFTTDPGYTYGGTGPSAVFTAGKYTVGSIPKTYNPSFDSIPDHTKGNLTGKQLIVNCNAGSAAIWTQTIRNIIPGTPYALSAWFVGAAAGGTPTKVRYSINGAPVGNLITPSNNGKWQNSYYVWTSNTSNATLSILTDASTTSGSSVCVDDISFAPVFPIIDTFKVTAIDSLKPVVSGDANICNGVSNISTVGVYDTYKWNNGATTKAIAVTQPGDYSVYVTEGDCKGTSDNFHVAASPKATITVTTQLETCSGEPNFEVGYSLGSGDILRYDSVSFDTKAKTAGFMDMGKLPVTNPLVLTLPKGVRPDIYNATLIGYNLCDDTTQVPIEFKVKYDSTILVQRWNDVLGVTNNAYNGGYMFTAYQWYKNGTLLSGQTGSNIYVSELLNAADKYSVLLTRKDDGVSIMTCDFSPTLLTGAAGVPSIVDRSEVIPIKQLSASGTATFWDITGRIESSQQIGANNANVQVPAKSGLYILQIATGEDSKQYKIIVR